MKKASEITVFGSRSFWKERIELWSVQGELCLRSVELPETPIFHWAKQVKSTVQLREEYLYRYPSALLSPSLIHQVAEMARKYVCYHADKDESTLSIWARLRNGLDELKIEQLFPLIPQEVLDFRNRRIKPMAMNGRESHCPIFKGEACSQKLCSSL